MKTTPIKTKIINKKGSLEDFLAESIKSLPENSVLAITSKIISILEGSIVSYATVSEETISPETKKVLKDRIIDKEADLFTPAELTDFDLTLSIKNNTLIPNAGIDESNAAGALVLWPRNPQETANNVWKFLRNHFSLNKFGVIITDSTVPILKRGTVGFAMAHCGFKAINNYVGRKDLFGRELQMTMNNVRDGLAASAVLTMGEGAEQTPLALIEDLDFIEFTDEVPTEKELDFLAIEKDNDLYQKLLNGVSWQKGKKSE